MGNFYFMGKGGGMAVPPPPHHGFDAPVMLQLQYIENFICLYNIILYFQSVITTKSKMAEPRSRWWVAK